ncbi:MAG: acyl phosphate:glycerol-3-phosphate acyltransferase [Thermosediminibacterales bacterium]|nr:acyl phosphate:glycerol-3-phosphate acyltransferase [Thermosediminibacterales bacterium]
MYGVIFLAYILGSIPSAYLVTKIFTGKDIREIGSGNMGAMNTFRNIGFIPGLITFCMDFGKGAFAANIALCLKTERWVLYAVILGLVLGHNWPAVLKFKGGKGLAVTAGALVLIDIKAGLVVFAVIGIATLVLKNTDIATIIGFAVYPFGIYIIQNDINVFLVGLIQFGVILVKHLSEVKRFFPG